MLTQAVFRGSKIIGVGFWIKYKRFEFKRSSDVAITFVHSYPHLRLLFLGKGSIRPGQIPISFVKSNSNQIIFCQKKSNQIKSNFLDYDLCFKFFSN